MAKVFEFNLSLSSIKELQDKLETYYQQLEASKLEIHQRLAAYAYERVMAYIPVDTGNLATSVYWQASQEMAIVLTNCVYAKFVEFGTGIVGKNNSHPEADEKGWQYDTNGHGDSGWRYLLDGELKWTKGQPAQKFMYQAYLDVQREAINIVREILKEKGLL